MNDNAGQDVTPVSAFASPEELQSWLDFYERTLPKGDAPEPPHAKFLHRLVLTARLHRVQPPSDAGRAEPWETRFFIERADGQGSAWNVIAEHEGEVMATCVDEENARQVCDALDDACRLALDPSARRSVVPPTCYGPDANSALRDGAWIERLLATHDFVKADADKLATIAHRLRSVPTGEPEGRDASECINGLMVRTDASLPPDTVVFTQGGREVGRITGLSTEVNAIVTRGPLAAHLDGERETR